MSANGSGPMAHFKQLAWFAALAALIPLLGACGKRKPPVPPHEHVSQVVTLGGFQRGDQIILAWQMPAHNAPKGSVQNISRADVYRLAEPVDAPLALTEEEFANRSTLIAALAITDADFSRKVLTYRDQLAFAGQPARLRYAIRFVNASGQKAGFSNALLIRPASKVSSAPSALTAKATQDAVKLAWTAPLTNIDQTTPLSIVGYNVYRSTSQKEPAKLLNKTPVQDTSFADDFFEFGKTYYYFVRAVSLGLSSEPVESAESNILEFKPVDVFPPSAPDALTIAAAPGSISLFFAVNPEKDVAGYKIYRSTSETLPREQWSLLTPELSKANTFHDTRVDSGKTYFYYVIAVDNAGNLSEPSSIVSETAP